MEHDAAGAGQADTGDASSPDRLAQTAFAERHVAGQLGEVNKLGSWDALFWRLRRRRARVPGRASRLCRYVSFVVVTHTCNKVPFCAAEL
jgi:hypothetical protein